MSILRPRLALIAGVIGFSLALSSCATGAPGGDAPAEPTPVIGEGTVIQVGDAAPQFCLGAIAESYPPQCSGPEIVGWDWDAYDGSETSGDVTWGTYAVWGEWDGTTLTATSAIQLALYDPMPILDPALDPENPGATPETELQDAQEQIGEEAPVEVLSSWIENGYLFVRVLFDTGTVQAWADERFGPDVVQIRPALRVIEE